MASTVNEFRQKMRMRLEVRPDYLSIVSLQNKTITSPARYFMPVIPALEVEAGGF
jgi:hypothetical protein